jgi:tetratricopeptide (TPR) repeat protein
MLQEERITQLKEFLKQQPSDMFSLFAMAMELKSLERFDESLAYLDRVLAVDAGYVAAYYQKALLLVKLSRLSEAKDVLQIGMPRAVEAGQLHARDRMRELLDILNSSHNS